MRKKIGELLVEAGVTSPADVQAALAAQPGSGGAKLGQLLVGLGRGVTWQHVARALSLQFELPFIELPQIPASVSSMVPTEFQSEHKIVPFQLEREGKVERLHLAIADPSNMDMVDELRFQLGKPIRVFVAAQDDIDDVLSALGGDAVAELEAVDVEVEDEDAAPTDVIAGTPIATDDWTSAPPPPVASPVAAAPLPPEWDISDAAPAPDPGRPPASNATPIAGGTSASSGVQAATARSATPPAGSAPVSNPVPGASRATASNATPPAGTAPVTSAPPVPEAALTNSSTEPLDGHAGSTMASASDLDDLLGDVSAASPPIQGMQPLTRPALPPPPKRNTPPSTTPAAQVHKFDPPPRATPAAGTPAPPSAVPLGATPVMGTPLTIPGASATPPPPSNLAPAAPAPAPALETQTTIDFSEEDLAILENLERMAQGDEPTLESAKVKPAQMVASLIRLLMKKGVIAETEFLEELGRK